MVLRTLTLKRLAIDTHKEAVLYVSQDCPVCASEGLESQSRVKVNLKDKSIIATLNIVKGNNLLDNCNASLSEYAWNLLQAKEGDEITISHQMPLSSLKFVRSKIYGNQLSKLEFKEIISDIASGKYSDIHISSFLTACAAAKLNLDEISYLTSAMIEMGQILDWDKDIVVDKHCVGGLPGNRTTPIIVSIVSEFGLTMPKTSSRAITSPAGTADTMEVLAPVELTMNKMQDVIKQENGCIVWGGSVSLSPADDILITVERVLDIDSEGQLVASVLSKKIAAGANHVLIDIPIGTTAKVRTIEMANNLKYYLEQVGIRLGIKVKVLFSDGSWPVGRGIGPSLEARDVVSVLKNDSNAPKDLRERALIIAGSIIEFSPQVEEGRGYEIAREILDSGRAWHKFRSICNAQGGIRDIPIAKYTHAVTSSDKGKVKNIDNRKIALIAKLAGAPNHKVAGVDLHVRLGEEIRVGQTLYTIHANSPGEISYVLHYIGSSNSIIELG